MRVHDWRILSVSLLAASLLVVVGIGLPGVSLAQNDLGVTDPTSNNNDVNPSVKPQPRPLPKPTTNRPLRPDQGTGVVPNTDSLTGEVGSPDLNGDGIVGYADIRILLGQWGPCRVNVAGDPCRADLDSNGEVDVEDLVALITAWSDEVPQSDMDELKRIPERCQAVTNSTLKRRCFMVIIQEDEVKSKERKILPALQNRLRDRATGSFSTDRTQSVEMRVKNYLRHWTNMLFRMTAAIERLEHLAFRIEERINKFEAEGRKLEEAKKELAAARESLEKARGGLNELSVSYEEVLKADDLKESFIRVRDMVRDLREAIKDSHRLLLKAIELIKAGLN
jgi:hypothetical protein